MFDQNKWDKWWDSLPPHTKTYLSNVPIWKHEEMIGAIIGAFAVGILVGLCF